MKFYYINTDRFIKRPSGTSTPTCDLWFNHKMAFTGDQIKLWAHSNLFRKLKVNDILFMYHTKVGYVGVGRVLEEWDHKCYQNAERLIYEAEPYEYRIKVEWFIDWRLEPQNAREDTAEAGLRHTHAPRSDSRPHK